MLRVEEELRHQRELMQQGFEQVNKRFETLVEVMNKHFETVDKRSEDMNKRFEFMDKRFGMLTQRIDRFMIWSFGITMGAALMVIAAIKIV